MTVKSPVHKAHLASHEDRLYAVRRTRAHLAELVYRSMRLEGDMISRDQAGQAVDHARGR